MHPVHRTPHVATFWWAGLSIATIVVLTLVSSDFIGLAILAIGLMVAAYYAATAIAAIVYFAPDLRRGPATLVVAGILPALGALLMIVAFVASAVDMARPEYVGSPSWAWAPCSGSASARSPSASWSRSCSVPCSPSSSPGASSPSARFATTTS